MTDPLRLSDNMLAATEGEYPLDEHQADPRARELRGPAWSIVVLAWLVRVSALLNLISSLLPGKLKLVYWLRPWMPFEISDGIRLRMFLTSLLLFALASGLQKGKRTAWLLTMATLAISPILHLGYVPVWPQMLINLGLIVFLLLHHRHFVVRSDRRSVRSALVICSVLAVALLAFGTVRLHDMTAETSGGDDWRSCLQAALELVLVQNAHAQAPQTITSADLFVLLRVGGITIALVGLILILRPVLDLQQIQAAGREKAKKLIERYGEDPFDSYALLEDKSYFVSGQNSVVIPYVRSANFAVALADPIGPPRCVPHAIVDFVLFCRRQDWEPVFYLAKEELIPALQKSGILPLQDWGRDRTKRPTSFTSRASNFRTCAPCATGPSASAFPSFGTTRLKARTRHSRAS